MTQQSLITRLKAVEEALAMFTGKVKHTINGADESCFVIGMRNQITESQMLSAFEALSDLRELIKEAEGKEPRAMPPKAHHATLFLETRIAELERENAELRKDADRYRFFKSRFNDAVHLLALAKYWNLEHDHFLPSMDNVIDAAIEAALAKIKEAS